MHKQQAMIVLLTCTVLHIDVDAVATCYRFEEDFLFRGRTCKIAMMRFIDLLGVAWFMCKV